MVDLAYPVRALGGQISQLHQHLKNVESYHFGKLYTIAYDDYVDYYLVQGPAKRVFNWIADNQKATYTIGASIIAALILYYAHPLRKDVNSSTDPDAANGPDEVEGEQVGGAPEGDEEIHSDHEGEVDGSKRPHRRKKTEGAEGSPRKESLEGAEGEKLGDGVDAEREVGDSDHEGEDDGTSGVEGRADKKPAAPTAAKAAASSKSAASTNAKGAAAAALLDSLFTDEDAEASGTEGRADKKPAAPTAAKGAAAAALLDSRLIEEGDDASGTKDASKPAPIASPAKAPATPAASAAKAAAAKAPATATSDDKDAAPSAAEAKPAAPAAVPVTDAK